MTPRVSSPFGVRTLPGWLRLLERHEVDPATQGTLGVEYPGTIHLDARNGLAPVILGRAMEIAVQKAREVGTGLVRVIHLNAAGPAAEIVAEAATGPMVALVLGPRPSWSLAVPTAAGLPAVFDTGLPVAADTPSRRRGGLGQGTARPVGGHAGSAARRLAGRGAGGGRARALDHVP